MQTSPKRATAWDLRRLVGSVNQIRFNDNRGEVSFFGQKMIILRRDVFHVMREGLERLVGDQAAPFLSFLASGIGIHEGSIFRDSVTATDETERRAALENLVHTALEDTNLGLGKLRVTNMNFDGGSAKVTIANCFESLENGPSENPNCMFTGGFLAGVFAEVLDKTVQANEVKCISQGQAECEFQISPTNESSRIEPSPPDIEDNIESPQTIKEGSRANKAQPQQKEDQDSKAHTEKSPTASIGTEPGTEKVATRTDFDSGVERATRIAKRKQRFWDRLLK